MVTNSINELRSSCQLVHSNHWDPGDEMAWIQIITQYHSSFRIRLWHFPPTVIPIFGHMWTEHDWAIFDPDRVGMCLAVRVWQPTFLHWAWCCWRRVPRVIRDPWDFRFFQGIVCADLTLLSKNDRKWSIHQMSPTSQELTLGRRHRCDKISMTNIRPMFQDLQQSRNSGASQLAGHFPSSSVISSRVFRMLTSMPHSLPRSLVELHDSIWRYWMLLASPILNARISSSCLLLCCILRNNPPDATSVKWAARLDTIFTLFWHILTYLDAMTECHAHAHASNGMSKDFEIMHADVPLWKSCDDMYVCIQYLYKHD